MSGGYDPRFDDTGDYDRRSSAVAAAATSVAAAVGMDMTHEMRFDLNGGCRPRAARPRRRAAAHRPMRRTFTARRFGSGYDAIQVNRLFDAIIASLSGRSGMPLNETELDPNQFSLVPGGYFEAEVNQALREVRDLVRR